MQNADTLTEDITKSANVTCERTLTGWFSQLRGLLLHAPFPLKRFLECPLTAPLRSPDFLPAPLRFPLRPLSAQCSTTDEWPGGWQDITTVALFSSTVCHMSMACAYL